MQSTDGGGSFLGAAQQGMFAIDTAAATQMMTSIQQIQERLEKRLKQIHLLKVKAKLGHLPEAQMIAELDAQVAAGDQYSLEFVLQQFTKALFTAKQALEIDMRNYEQVDARAAQSFRRIGE
jgi:hypothetical protein